MNVHVIVQLLYRMMKGGRVWAHVAGATLLCWRSSRPLKKWYESLFTSPSHTMSHHPMFRVRCFNEHDYVHDLMSSLDQDIRLAQLIVDNGGDLRLLQLFVAHQEKLFGSCTPAYVFVHYIHSIRIGKSLSK